MYKPSQKLCVDECMVKSKHMSGIRQYTKDKTTKWGLKFWVLADSDNSFTVDFNLYVGKETAKDIRARAWLQHCYDSYGLLFRTGISFVSRQFLYFYTITH